MPFLDDPEPLFRVLTSINPDNETVHRLGFLGLLADHGAIVRSSRSGSSSLAMRNSPRSVSRQCWTPSATTKTW